MRLEGLTGRGVRVAIIDSGVNAAHPHVGAIAGGVFVTPAGPSRDYVDYLGHGTAVTAAIREKAPDAELYAVKVFDRVLSTQSDILLQALEWCLERGMHVINLSLGTRKQDRRSQFEELLARAAQSQVIVVAAQEAGGELVLPGCLPGAFAVGLAPACPRDTYHAANNGSGVVFYASGYPRPLPGLPQERNLNGISFAVANMTGFVARAREAVPDASSETIRQLLLEDAVQEAGCNTGIRG